MRNLNINSLKKYLVVFILIFFILGCKESVSYYNSEPACRIFFELTEGVMKDEMPIDEINHCQTILLESNFVKKAHPLKETRNEIWVKSK